MSQQARYGKYQYLDSTRELSQDLASFSAPKLDLLESNAFNRPPMIHF